MEAAEVGRCPATVSWRQPPWADRSGQTRRVKERRSGLRSSRDCMKADTANGIDCYGAQPPSAYNLRR